MLVNPVSFRLSISTFWRSVWTVYQIKNYKYLLFSDLIFFEYFNWFCKKFFTNIVGSCLISHIRFYKIKNKIIINIFYYHSDFDNLLKQLNYFKMKDFKRQKKIRRIRIKKNKFKYKRFFLPKKRISNYILNQKKRSFKNLYKFSYVLKKYILKKKKFRKKIICYRKKKDLLTLNTLRLLKLKNKKNKKYIFKSKKKKIRKKKNLLIKKKFTYLFYLNTLKIQFCFKYFLYNLYIFCLKKFMKQNTMLFKFFFKNIYDFNFIKIDLKHVTASIISQYLQASLATNYNLMRSLRPVLLDLNKRIYLGEISGFKISFSGRFKRTQMATYFWRKNGKLGTGSVIFDIDYNFSILKTKYGVCAIKILLGKEKNLFKSFQNIYPLFNPFFIKQKTYIINSTKIVGLQLQSNKFFIHYFYKLFFVGKTKFYKYYYIHVFKRVLLNYIYFNTFIRNIILKAKINKIFLPQYLSYKINFFDLIYNINTFIIFPLVNYKYLKRINIRSSYKLRFFNKIKYKLKSYKYKIYLR